jgi:hypothetical protein
MPEDADADEPTCQVCGEPLDPTDELANLELHEMHDERDWTWHFCCPNHLLEWLHSDPTELEPYLTFG